VRPATTKALKKRRWAPLKPGEASTERMPSAVATMPMRFPSLAVECLLSPRIAAMNITAELREKIPT